MARFVLDVAALSDTGRCRTYNEDAFRVTDLRRCTSLRPPSACARLEGQGFVLGMYDGCGHGPMGFPGDIAAEAVHMLMCALPVANGVEELVPRLSDAVAVANRALFEANVGGGAGMGASATIAARAGDVLALAQVGDTRAYLFRDGRLIQLTRDHTLIEHVRALMAPGSEEAARLPELERRWRESSAEELDQIPKNVIMRALGCVESISADVTQVRVHPGDTLLLCTDGLHGQVRDAEVAAILSAHRDPEVTCRALVEATDRAGGYDNVTVLVAKVAAEEGPLGTR
jgi:protein phosphatase